MADPLGSKARCICLCLYPLSLKTEVRNSSSCGREASSQRALALCIRDVKTVSAPDDGVKSVVNTGWYELACDKLCGPRFHQSSYIYQCPGKVSDHPFPFLWWNVSFPGDCSDGQRNPVVYHGREARLQRYRPRILYTFLQPTYPLHILFLIAQDDGTDIEFRNVGF